MTLGKPWAKDGKLSHLLGGNRPILEVKIVSRV